MPGVVAASASRELLFRQKYAAFGRSLGCSVHGLGIGRADFIIVMNLLCEDRSFHERGNHFREQQVGDGAQSIAGGGMSGDIDAQPAQLLNQTPDFGPGGAKFLGNLRAAGDYRGVPHEQAHDAAQAGIGSLVNGWRAACFGWNGDVWIIANDGPTPASPAYSYPRSKRNG